MGSSEESVSESCSSLLSNFNLPDPYKHTLITLIPKVKYSSSITDFRPISLCNTFYKVVAKVLASRLKLMLPSIINESQTAFIHARDIADSLALAHEISNDMKKRQNQRYFCAKLDLLKAFDSVNRNSIIHRLTQKGFPTKFVNWISACILNIPFSIVLNGEIKGFFRSSNGLKQGCPLSLFLFTIAIDYFSCFLDDVVRKNDFPPYSIKDYGVSHLLFADDLLVVGEASMATAHSLNKCLTVLADTMGLVVNRGKSVICYTSGAKEGSAISNSLNINSGNFPFTYLGIPLALGKLNAIHFNPLLDKIVSWLAG